MSATTIKLNLSVDEARVVSEALNEWKVQIDSFLADMEDGEEAPGPESDRETVIALVKRLSQ